MKTAATWVGTISPNTVLSYTESDALTMFNAGKAAFMRHWSSAYRSVARDSGANFAGVTLLPAGPAGRAHTIGGFHWAVSKYSEHPRQAAELVNYLTGQEVQTRRALARGYVPTYPELYQRPDLVKALPQTVVLREAENTSWTPRPSTITGDKYAAASKAYYQSVHQILSNNIAAEVALPELARKLAEITGFRESVPDGRKHVQ
jgi:trehalose/maltose transport system substrate-binding protein